MNNLAENRNEIIEKYRSVASYSDRLFAFTFPLRRLAVSRLELPVGGRVLDMGCGSGASFSFLESALGASGSIVGVDISPDMIAAAENRVEVNNWQNVELILGAAEESAFKAEFDGILLFAMHDVLTSPAALDTILKFLKPGGRIAAVGPVTAEKLPARWLNPLVRLVYRRFAVSQRDLDRPWRLLEERLPGLVVERRGPGIIYLAYGRKAGA